MKRPTLEIILILVLLNCAAYSQTRTTEFSFSFENKKYSGLIDQPSNGAPKSTIILIPGSGSRQATQFRIWATKTLREFIIKGFVLDDERLKQGKRFGKDYFDELLECIREIRASERRFYQKIK